MLEDCQPPPILFFTSTKNKAMKKEKWKPKLKELYYFCYFFREKFFFATEFNSYPHLVSEEKACEDKMRIESGNCFRTKREATKICKKLNSAIKKILTDHADTDNG
jgi:hypothetical protein